MPIIATCDHCDQRYSLPLEAVGTTKTCRLCNAKFVVVDPYHNPIVTAASHKTDWIPVTPPAANAARKWRWIFTGVLISFALTTLPLLVVMIVRQAESDAKSNSSKETQLGWTGTGDFEIPHEMGTTGNAIYDRVSENIVLIHSIGPNGLRGRSSGFILSPGNRLITNEHVVNDAHFVVVETYWGQRLTINRIVAIDERRDLAILPLPKEFKGRGLVLAESTHAIGERIYVVGSPKDTFFSITEGVISQFSDSHRKVLELVADIGSAPGGSGSPVVDSKGKVIGVVARGSITSHVVRAVHYKELVALIEESADQPMKTMEKISLFDLN